MPSDDRLLRAGLGALAVGQLALGAFMALAPASFHDRVGPYGSVNEHYIRDMASWELALALLAGLAVRRPGWRIPVLALALVHFVLHAANHLLDVGQADPAWLGPVNLVALVGGAALLGGLLLVGRRRAAR